MQSLPEDGELQDITTLQFTENTLHTNDQGPASEQTEINVSEGFTNSGAQLPDSNINIRSQVESILQDVIGDNHGDVSVNKRGTVTIPWPTRDNIPVSEFTTQYFFTLAFPALFPYGSGDFYINRPNTCSSMGDWAEHLLWYNDGRFAKHPYFKFLLHNMIMRKKSLNIAVLLLNKNWVINISPSAT